MKTNSHQQNYSAKDYAAKIKEKISTLGKIAETVSWQDKKIYGNFIAQSFYYVRNSTRILALAAARFSLKQNEAHQRFLKHISEENHHERLLENDLKALGYSIEQFPEQSAIRAFYQIQYYLIEHRDPMAVMGFILALEGLAVEKGVWLSEKIKEFHGPKCGTFMKVHAAEDVDHLQSALQLLNGLPENTMVEIMEALDTCIYLYGRMMKDL